MASAGKRDRLTMAAMMADCEEAMITLRSSLQVVTYMQKKYAKEGMSERTVYRMMARVRKEWRKKATLDNRDARRDDMRETLSTILRTALTRTELVKDENGRYIYAMERDPVSGAERRKLNEKGHPMPMTRPKPDLQRALHACNQLRHLDALDEPFKAQLIIDAELADVPDLKKISPEAYERLRDVLQGISPGGDLRKLAGDLFTGGASGGMVN